MIDCLYMIAILLSLWVAVSAETNRSLQSTLNIPPLELQALNDLYTSTNGESWAWEEDTPYAPWDFSNPNANPCGDQWQGVTCIQFANDAYQHILTLSLGDYALNGTLPASMDQLAHIALLDLSGNNLYGTIPKTFGNFANLSFLALNYNQLNGTIPTSLGNLSQISLLALNNNDLSGPIPPQLCNLTSLESIRLEYNELTGTIPESIGQLLLLEILTFHFNRLTGTIPVMLGTLIQLEVLYLHYNQLHGTIPASIGNLTQLVFLDVDSNRITGTVPSTLHRLSHLQIFSMEHNQLTGPLPGYFDSFPDLIYLTIFNNYLTGTIPASLGQLQNLFQFSVAHNFLSGTIPSDIGRMASLNSFAISNNYLEGTLDNIFDPALQHNLVSVVVNNNQLTGTLPSALFTLSALRTIVASTNCFHGTLPATICNATTLYSIVLDGLSSAPVCKNIFLPGLSDSYSTTQTVHGTVPACLFQMPALRTLHLSGNGFTGKILSTSSNVTVSPLLLDLSLSHNFLTGTLPAQIQDRAWVVLDVSYNKLYGSLSRQLATKRVNISSEAYHYFIASTGYTPDGVQVYLSLENNRLSGEVPHSLLHLQHISILQSNAFTCDLDGSDLPQQDSAYNNYQCGSQEFDMPYFVWLGLCVGCALVLVIIIRYQPKALSSMVDVEYYRGYWDKWTQCVDSYVSKSAQSYRDLFHYLQLLDLLTTQSLLWTGVIVLTLVPLYVILSHYYGTHQQAYAWTVSAAYLSGPVPFALLCVMWLCILFAAVGSTVVQMMSLKVTDLIVGGKLATQNEEEEEVSRVSQFLVYITYFLANIVIVGGVNVAYMYIAIYRGSSLLTFAQIFLSFFKLIYNGVVSTTILKRIVQYFTSKRLGLSGYGALRMVVGIVNNIVIPFVLVLVISPNCFYNVFSAPPTVNAVFTHQVCISVRVGTNQCQLYGLDVDTSSYDPPFAYSYQCSSSLITYYAPAYVNMCIVSMFLMPVMHVIAVKLLSRADKTTQWYQMLEYVIPRAWRVPSVGEAYTSTRQYFSPSNELTALLNYIALLFTFGIVFPPLGVALMLSLVLAYTLTRLKLGRFLHQVSQNNLESAYVSSVDEACLYMEKEGLLKTFLYVLCVLGCSFYTLFLFDTLGDAEGFYQSYWVLIFLPLLSISVVCVVEVYVRMLLLPKIVSRSAEEKIGVELTSTNGISKENCDDGATFNVIVASSA